MQKQTEQETKKTRVDSGGHQKLVGGAGMKCPHCGELVNPHLELCPLCGYPLHSDHCTFCGAPMAPDEKFCSECDNSTQGILCPKCGTLNFRSFCSNCHEPLDDLALEAIAQAESSPDYQEIKRMVEDLDNVSEGEFSLKLAKLNDALKRMQPPANLTPQMERNFFSARDVMHRQKVKRIQEVPLGWVCNYCGCLHGCPEQCVSPELGGEWIVGSVETIDEVERWSKE